MVGDRAIGLHVDTSECNAGSTTWWHEGSCEQLRVYILVQLGKLLWLEYLV